MTKTERVAETESCSIQSVNSYSVLLDAVSKSFFLCLKPFTCTPEAVNI